MDTSKWDKYFPFAVAGKKFLEVKFTPYASNSEKNY
jgi:hypothetical protein